MKKTKLTTIQIISYLSQQRTVLINSINPSHQLIKIILSAILMQLNLMKSQNPQVFLHYRV